MAQHSRRIALAALAAGLLQAPLAHAADASSSAVVINFSTTGSAIVDFTFQHAADGQHFCSTSSAGWDQASGTGSAYEVRYDAGPRRAAEHFRLLAPNYQQGASGSTDPSGWIDFWADGDEWLGHGKDDPKFKLEITFAPDGSGGTFKASHLRAARDGKISPGDETVDVKGEWHCPPGTTAPETH